MRRKHILFVCLISTSVFIFCGAGKISYEEYPQEKKLVPVVKVELEYPKYLKSYIDPNFNNKVTRITDSKVFGYKNPRHNYSKNQPWNANGQYIRIRNNLLDGKTYKLLRKIPYLDEAKWSHINPLKIYGFHGNGRFSQLSLVNDQIRVLREFTGYDEVRMGPWEGNISTDDKYVVFAARKGKDLTVIVYNIADDLIIAKKQFSNSWERLDWVSISPSGKYILFNWKPVKGSASKVIDCYSRDIKFIRRLAHQGCHGDMGYTADGTELYIQFEFGDQRGIWAYKLSSGKRYRLLPDKYNGGHLSCRNIKRPGWCYLSCNKKGYKGVFALKLDGSGMVNRFAKHHSSAKSYVSEAQAVPNPDGTKVMFASDWDGQHEVNSYIIENPKSIETTPLP